MAYEISFSKVIYYIFSIILVCSLAYFVCKYLYKDRKVLDKNILKRNFFNNNFERKLEIKERLFVGRNREIILLKADKKEYILGINGDNFYKIDTILDEDDNNE
ncbi:MAG: hypothetical protein N4A54_03720 [Peptostreptococcaceae bacterium]|jgi:flagellar biogenesis protein FliO|nr:hypothetical protein [Peptostreptococcaceae bacterium]